MIATESETPRVWVGCLACYNAGTLRGEWVDAVDAAEFVPCEGRGHEEWWVFDHEYLPVSGELSPVEAAKIAQAMTGIEPAPAVRAYIDNTGIAYIDWDTLADDFAESFSGEWDDLAAYAYDLFSDTSDRETVAQLDSWPFSCIDWDHAGRELHIGGDVWTADSAGGVYVFRNVR